MKHTALPWLVGIHDLGELGFQHEDELPIYTEEQGADGPVIAAVWPMGEGNGAEEQAANAALIVVAVNAHESLRRNLAYIDYAANWADNDYSGEEVVEIRVTEKALRDIHSLLSEMLEAK